MGEGKGLHKSSIVQLRGKEGGMLEVRLRLKVSPDPRVVFGRQVTPVPLR